MPKVKCDKHKDLNHNLQNDLSDYSDDEEDDGCEEEAEDDEASSTAGSGRVVQTVPAREPRMDAVPLKSALKKPPGAVVVTRQQNGRQKASSPAQEKNQNSRYYFKGSTCPGFLISGFLNYL